MSRMCRPRSVPRGDIHYLKADRVAKRHEQRGPRRAIVVQAARLPLSTVVIVPTTTAGFESAWRVPIEFDDGVSYAMCEQVRSIDPDQRLGAFVGMTSFEELAAIDQALRLVLDL